MLPISLKKIEKQSSTFYSTKIEKKINLFPENREIQLKNHEIYFFPIFGK